MKRTSLLWLAVVLAGCAVAPIRPTATATATSAPATASRTATVAPTDTPPPPPTATPPPITMRFAVIGDFGTGDQAEADVAALVHSWNPDIVLTVGDDNYPSGGAQTIDRNIGAYYQDFIDPYTGAFGPGAAENRFFPTLGNHDWYTNGAEPYLAYFTLPGNERYYEFTWGPVSFFALDSDPSEPDGVGQSSAQAAWLEQSLAASTSPWNVVYFHHPPYSSGIHGGATWMQWPFAAWGADAVLAGHDHTYERLLVDSIPYFVDGLGGGPIYNFVNILPESQARFSGGHGAMLVTATDEEMDFAFYTIEGELIDSCTLRSP